MKINALLVALFAAFSAHAACEIHFVGRGAGHVASNDFVQLSWLPVPGANQYVVEKTVGAATETFRTDLTSVGVQHIVLRETSVSYHVTALRLGDPTVILCAGTATYTVVPDVELQQAAGRLVIPVAGTADGANGSKFVTRLALSGTPHPVVSCPLCPRPTPSVSSGRVIFHPAGRAASAEDPSIAYRLTNTSRTEASTIVFDDVMASIGASGLGWLEIVADPDSTLPFKAEAWIFNVGSGLNVGTRVEAIYGGDHFDRDREAYTIISAPERERISVGALLLAGRGEVMIILRSVDGKFAVASTNVEANTQYHVSLASLFPDTPISKGDSVTVRYVGDLVTTIGVVYITTTDNKTNDSEILISKPNGTYRNPNIIDN